MPNIWTLGIQMVYKILKIR